MARICIIRQYYYPQDTHVRRNAQALIEKGHQVDLLCLRADGQSAEETVSGVRVHRLPLQHRRRGMGRYLLEHAGFFVLASAALLWLHLRKRFDLVEVDTMPDFLVFATIIPKLLGARIVLYLFEAMPEEVAAKFMLRPNHPAVALLRIVEQLAIRYADRVITVSGAICSIFVSRGAVPGKIAVVLNVPDECVFHPALATGSTRQRGEGIRLITHGTLIEVYGVQVALCAVARLMNLLPGVWLSIVGDGEYRPALEQLAHELGIGGAVSFTGWVSQDQVVRCIREADVGLVPILAGYGDLMVPNKLFEYVALRKPVIASDLKAIRDYFDERSLLFFEPGHDAALAGCVERLYWNRRLAEGMTHNAYAVYERCRWSRAKEIYCNLFDDGRSGK